MHKTVLPPVLSWVHRIDPVGENSEPEVTILLVYNHIKEEEYGWYSSSLPAGSFEAKVPKEQEPESRSY